MSRSTHRRTGTALAFLAASALTLHAATASAQAPYSIEDVLSPAFPYSLVSATGVDRIAWLEYERGMRNVYTATPPAYTPTRLTSWLEDDGVDLQSLQVSADGEIVTFLRGHEPNGDGWVANPTSDPRGAERVVWAMSTKGGNPWRVVEADEYDLSPDGRWVVYEHEGQIHRAPVSSGLDISVDPGAPFFLAYGDNEDPVWSPDGTRVAFVSDRGDHSFIGVYDARSPTITYLAPGVDHDTSPAWSADGTRIAFLRRPGDPFGARASMGQHTDSASLPAGLLDATFAGGHRLEIWTADARTGEGQRLWHAPAEAEDEGFSGSVNGIHWKGDHIAFEAEPGNWRHWYSVSVERPAARPTELTPGEGFVEHVAFSADGRYLYYASNTGDIDRRDLYRVQVSGGRAERLTDDEGIETYPAVLASGDDVAVLHADTRRPLSVAVVPADGGDARPITALPTQYPLAQHVVTENVTISAEDSLEFNNQLFLPPDLRPGERRPALIFIHGGSRRQMLLGWHYSSYYHNAYALNQHLASRGYVVLSINYRSGTGYGMEFREAPNYGSRGASEVQDVVAGGRYLRARSDVDPARVGVWGGSYGGYLTAMALATASDVFAAGFDLHGVHAWNARAGFSPFSPLTSDQRDSVVALARKSSPVGNVGTWRSPVLFVHGDDDRNVHFNQGVALMAALRSRDVEVEYLVIPHEIHSFLLHSSWVRAFEAAAEFFDRRLKHKSAPESTHGSP